MKSEILKFVDSKKTQKNKHLENEIKYFPEVTTISSQYIIQFPTYVSGYHSGNKNKIQKTRTTKYCWINGRGQIICASGFLKQIEFLKL